MNRPVIIFDSGVGGFSILRAVQATHLGYPLAYLADQRFFPYGDRSPAWLGKRLNTIVGWVSSFAPAALVLACNTATVHTIAAIRRLVPFPVVGVEPVTKPLAGVVHPLLLITQSTLAHLSKVNIPSVNPPGLAEAIENMDNEAVLEILRDLKPLLNQYSVETLGLSCTHYPLASSLIHQLYPHLSLCDPSFAVAKRLSSLLPSPSSPSSDLAFFTTGNPQTLATQVQYYLALSTNPQKVIL